MYLYSGVPIKFFCTWLFIMWVKCLLLLIAINKCLWKIVFWAFCSAIRYRCALIYIVVTKDIVSQVHGVSQKVGSEIEGILVECFQWLQVSLILRWAYHLMFRTFVEVWTILLKLLRIRDYFEIEISAECGIFRLLFVKLLILFVFFRRRRIV